MSKYDEKMNQTVGGVSMARESCPEPGIGDNLRDRFRHHKPGEAIEIRLDSVRDLCGTVAREIQHLTPVSREQSLALTHVEEVMFWANAAIARHQG